MKISNFKMDRDVVEFRVSKKGFSGNIEIKLKDIGRTTMNDYYEFGFLNKKELYELDSLTSALSGILMINAREREEEEYGY